MRYIEIETEESYESNGGFVRKGHMESKFYFNFPKFLKDLPTTKVTIHPSGVWVDPFEAEGWFFEDLFRALTKNGFIYKTTFWKNDHYRHIFVQLEKGDKEENV